MGTRSLTFTYSDNQEKIICLYRQFDGYPEGHGADLAEILNNTKSNGMECLSASIVAKLKTDAYNFYLYPTSTTDAWQEYEYHVYDGMVKVIAVYGGDGKGEELFHGSYADFQDFCNNQDRKVA